MHQYRAITVGVAALVMVALLGGCGGGSSKPSLAAQDQLVGLYRHIAAAASPDIAARYTDAIVTDCEGLGTFPQRGSRRDDIRPGLRITNFRRRAAIALPALPTSQFHTSPLMATLSP